MGMNIDEARGKRLPSSFNDVPRWVLESPSDCGNPVTAQRHVCPFRGLSAPIQDGGVSNERIDFHRRDLPLGCLDPSRVGQEATEIQDGVILSEPDECTAGGSCAQQNFRR